MNGRTYRQLYDVETGHVVVARMELADTPWKRSIGLLGRGALSPGEGLWLSPCSGVHTLFMRFALDLAFLDRSGVAIRLAPNVRPWRFQGPLRGARVVIEMPAGTIALRNLTVGRKYGLGPIS